MMHIVIGEYNLHGIILEYLKEFFHNIFEASGQCLDTALLEVVAEQFLAEREEHLRQVGNIEYIGGF